MQETGQTVRNEADLQMIKELRLMDDDFFSEALDVNAKLMCHKSAPIHCQELL